MHPSVVANLTERGAGGLSWAVLVTEDGEVAATARALATAPLVAFDVEFASAERLVPKLCLLQVAWLGEHVSLDAPARQIVAAVPEIRLLDPLAVDVAPVVHALAAHPMVVAHSPRQDLQLLAQRFGPGAATMPGLIDTQLMAAFAGIGDQVGLGSLVRELLGIELEKGSQFTNWARRPLSPAQLEYAPGDVAHLHAIYATLRDRLGERIAWARAETAEVARDALEAASVTVDTAWRDIAGLRTLDRAGLAAGIALAAWRFRTATELDRPLGQVLGEKLLIDFARHRADGNAVRNAKGVSPIARQRADEIADAIATADVSAVAAIARQPSHAPSVRAQRWAELLLAIAHVVADDSRIASRLLATRSDAEEFARTADEAGLAAITALPALATWRRDVIGAAWRGFLDGSLALVGDAKANHGIALVAR